MGQITHTQKIGHSLKKLNTNGGFHTASCAMSNSVILIQTILAYAVLATINSTTKHRGQIIMACGNGKTFTTLWIKDALDALTTPVLLPSLTSETFWLRNLSYL